jgi:preprotein translocase subunit SecG
MLYALVILVHVIACIILIAVILLQAGRGGGLSEAFGGDSSNTIFGTKASVFLTKATVVAASLYLITCLGLGIMTSRRGRSLIDLKGRKRAPVTLPAMPAKGTPLAQPEEIPAE